MDSVRYYVLDGNVWIAGWDSAPVSYSPERLALAIANLDRYTPSTRLSQEIIEGWRGALCGAMDALNARYATGVNAGWGTIKGGVCCDYSS
jgi:hypothetical protein